MPTRISSETPIDRNVNGVLSLAKKVVLKPSGSLALRKDSKFDERKMFFIFVLPAAGVATSLHQHGLERRI